MEGPEIEHAHPHHVGRRWVDLLLGICAVSISFISLFLAIHNGHAMERLVQANSWPLVQITFSTLNADGTPHIHLDMANKGVGPARIEFLEVAYDGKPVSDPRALVNAMLNRTTAPLHPRIQTATMAHSVLAAREAISFFDTKPEAFSAEDYEALRVGVEKLNFRACYCSAFDECWVVGTSQPRAARVQECPVSASSF